MRELTYFPLLESYPKTSGYGYRVDPITGAQTSFHRGVDYGAPSGAPVIAPYDGQVTTGYESGGAGNWLWVVNGSDMFKSFHHSAFAITSGWVPAGTVIAYIGSTGASTGSHAHLELWEGSINIDPTGYLDRAPLFGGGPTQPPPVVEEDDLNIDELRKEMTGQTSKPTHEVYPAWMQDNRNYQSQIVYEHASDTHPEGWWIVFGIFKWRIPHGYEGWWDMQPVTVRVGDAQGGTWQQAMLDSCIELSVGPEGGLQVATAVADD